MLNPGGARIRKFTINGVDVSPITRELKMFESLMRPFQVSETIMYDDQNLINTKKWEGGETVEIVFDTGGGKVYETKLKLHSIAKLNNFPGLRTQAYKFNIAGESFFNNSNSKILMPFQNISGAQAIEKLHNKYLNPSDASLKITNSKGFIGEKVPYIVSNMYPFDAIIDIRGRLTHEKYKTGAYTYFRNNENYMLSPLEELFDKLSPTYEFTHNPTFGADFTDIQKQFKNIIQFVGGASFGSMGKSSATEIQKMAKNAKTNITSIGETYYEGKKNNPKAGIVSGSPSYSTYDTGGMPFERTVKNIPNDPKLNKFSPVAEKIDAEQLYGKLIQNGPACTIGVFMGGGLNCTVGKGVFANIAAPAGIGSPSSDNQMKGNYLVVNLCHHLKLYDKTPQGLTKMELVRGGVS